MQIRIGNKTHKSIRWTFLLAGLLLIAFGVYVVLSVTVPEMQTTLSEDYDKTYIMVAGGISCFLGLILVIICPRRYAKTVFLRKHKCMIADTKMYCGGGCNKCIFASRYIQLIGDKPQSKE